VPVDNSILRKKAEAKNPFVHSLPEVFALDDDETIPENPTRVSYDSLDTCIDSSRAPELCNLRDLIQGPIAKRKRSKTQHLKPVAFVRMNTRHGKAKPTMVKALLDSGASSSLIARRVVTKLRKHKTASQTWSTPAGSLTTNETVKSQFTLPELQDDQLIEWNLHVTEDLGAADMIIGRDLLEFLQIDILFSEMEVHWGSSVMPFKEADASVSESYHVQDDGPLEESSARIKRILDAKYEPADIEEVIDSQSQLGPAEKHQLRQLLLRHESLFDGTLGKWTGSQVKLVLNKDAEPYHARAFPVPRVHLETLRMEVERLCELGVLKKVNQSQWAAPTFVIPKKDGTVRFISDFRELNKRIRRQPYPIPNIQDMLLNLDGFQHATSLDLNMGYYHLELSEDSRELCTIVLPFGKYEYQRIPMGLCNSPDIFQEKMNELFEGLDYVRAYIDDLLVLTKGTFEDHLEKLETVFRRLQDAGLKVNARKSFFARGELEYLGYWITREGIQPMKDKVAAIMNIAEPKTRKQLRSFIGVVNYYRDMWIRRSHILAPLASLTSTKTKWSWGPKQKAAFAMAKKVIAREAMLAYPDFTKPFVIHTDASHYQLGGVISQDGKPIAFYSRKLNDAQTRYTTTERELLSIVETLKEYRNILLGHQIEVFTDHKNLVFKHFNTERVMRWRLILEEFGPKLTYIKGEHNIVADTLSRMELTEAEFSEEAFCAEAEDFPRDYPLLLPQLVHEQNKSTVVKNMLNGPSKLVKKTTMRRADKTYELVTRDSKIVVPPSLQRKAAEWYHLHLLHPGETRTELTIAQHYYWKGMKKDIQNVCQACSVCLEMKRKQKQYGLIPAKRPEIIPWHTLCIDLIGPYTFGKKDNEVKLHCLTMIDPATGWFEIVEIPRKRADYVINYLEFTWLTRYPWPTEIVMDRGREFAAEVRNAIKNDYGITRKLITTQNPQANAMVERVHQTLHNMIRTAQITGKSDLDEDFGWMGILAACRQAVRSTVHTTTMATPTQLVYGRDAILNVGFEANWQYIKERKQRLITQNNRRENATRVPYNYAVGDRVMVKLDPKRKHGSPQYMGPVTVVQVNDNGTVKLTKVAQRGAVYQTWNVRNIYPCKD